MSPLSPPFYSFYLSHPSHKFPLPSRLILSSFPDPYPSVSSLLRKGTSIRRTNETDMNAQSSRSHAIFSLTLTQKKYVGSNPLLPPRSSSPLPPGGPGRSPSRLARPGSMIAGPSNRVSSPTFGRPGTPSFGSAINRSSLQGSGLRPPSSLGFHHADREPAEPITPGGDGDWVTVVSKFHFVDLAGSERVRSAFSYSPLFNLTSDVLVETYCRSRRAYQRGYIDQ